MRRMWLCALLGAFLLPSCILVVQAQGGSSIKVKGWRWCSANVSENRCVSPDSIQRVRIFDAQGAPQGEVNLSGVTPQGELSYNTEYNLVGIKANEGKVVWVQARLLDLIYCDAATPAGTVRGTPPTTAAIAMGSGGECKK